MCTTNILVASNAAVSLYDRSPLQGLRPPQQDMAIGTVAIYHDQTLQAASVHPMIDFASLHQKSTHGRPRLRKQFPIHTRSRSKHGSHATIPGKRKTQRPSRRAAKDQDLSFGASPTATSRVRGLDWVLALMRRWTEHPFGIKCSFPPSSQTVVSSTHRRTTSGTTLETVQ